MGEQVGGYEIEEALGEGGMAEVFAAVLRGEGGFARRVCVKRLRPEYAADADMIELFGDEARIMAALHHPAITTVLELGHAGGRPFLAMELVEGADLREVLRSSGRLDAELVALLAHDLASALEHAHAAVAFGVAQRVVHRDVSPANVLVSTDGAVKLTDFGIAKASRRLHRTAAGVVKGKVPYMAPEQALGGEVDQRADLFSLGVVLFEALAGVRPHDGRHDLETIERAQRGARGPLAELAPLTPAWLVEIVERLLAPRPSDRFASATELLEALASLPAPLSARRALGALARRAQARRARRRAVARGVDEAGTARAGRALLAAPTVPDAPGACRMWNEEGATERMSSDELSRLCAAERARWDGPTERVPTPPRERPAASALPRVAPARQGPRAASARAPLPPRTVAWLALGWLALTLALGAAVAHVVALDAGARAAASLRAR